MEYSRFVFIVNFYTTSLGFVASWLCLSRKGYHLEEAAKPSYNWLLEYSVDDIGQQDLILWHSDSEEYHVLPLNSNA